MICIPIGTPARERLIGITVAGNPGGGAKVLQTIRDGYGEATPSISMRRGGHARSKIRRRTHGIVQH
jgi:hypothetical protein